MKTRLLIILGLFVASISLAFAHGHDSTRTITFVPVSASGKVIYDSTAAAGKKYYLDTNKTDSKDYLLSFGPKWYTPTSGATRPLNGDIISITGDLFSNSTPPVIAVYTINGLKWRDSLGTRFIHNPADKDSLAADSLRHGHHDSQKIKDQWGNHFGWCATDSLDSVSLAGVVKVDSVGKHHAVFYLNTNSDTTYEYVLMFGPDWYTPTSGATRPVNGQTVSIKGGLIQKSSTTTTINYVVVYQINGLSWVDSTGKFPWPGKQVGKGHMNSVKVASMYNSNTYCTYDNQSFGMGHNSMMYPSSIYTSIMEIDPVALPMDYSGNAVSAYALNVTNTSAQSIFMSFEKDVTVSLAYTKQDLANANIANKNLKLKYYTEDNVLADVPSAKFNYTTNTVTFSQSSPSALYIIEGTTLATTSVKTSDAIPEKIELGQNYPNPFNPTTTISFAIPQNEYVKLTVYNILGSEVKTLHTGNLEAGTYNITWDGTNNIGNKVASGIYMYKLSYAGKSMVKKMSLLK